MCEFSKNGVCHALACYSNEDCGARDENGNPIYADLEAIENEKSNNPIQPTG